jgi:DNA polymerase-1
MALTAGVPESDMREVDAAFNSRYPGVKQFSMRIEDAGMRRQRSEGQGYVLTQTGRRLPCDEGKVYTLVNYAIQGGAAEVFKLNLLKLDAAGLTPHMIVPVHDEIVMSVPRADVEEIKKVVKDCMTTTEGWAVPLTAGCDGPFENWGEAVDA